MVVFTSKPEAQILNIYMAVHVPLLFVSLIGLCLVLAGFDAGQNRQPPRGLSTPGITASMKSIRPLATFNVPGAPDWMTITESSVWITSEPTNTVTKLNSRTNTIGHLVTVVKPCSGLAYGYGSIWSPSCGEQALVRFNAETGEIQAKIALRPADSEGSVAIGAGSVWMLISGSGVLVRIDPKTNGISKKIRVPPGSVACLFGGGRVWVSSPVTGIVASVDPLSNKVTDEIKVGNNPRFLTFGEGAVWILKQGDGEISRIDASTCKLVTNIEAGLQGEGGEITFGEGAIWATIIGFPITKIDPKSNTVTRQWSGPGGDSIRVGLGSLWLTDIKGHKVAH